MVTTNNIIFAGIITISLTVIGALLSDVFQPLSESLKDKISGVPQANVTSAKIFDNDMKNVSKAIDRGQEDVSANAVTFYFIPGQAPENIYRFLLWNYSLNPYLPKINYSYQFECSFDGSSYEDCSSPKPYFDLQTEAVHAFKVKTKGILGNTQDEPTRFDFTSITSSRIKGITEKYGIAIPNATVIIDEHVSNISQITDSIGSFSFKEIGQGPHNYTIYENKTTDPTAYTEDFFIPAGIEWKELDKKPLEEMKKTAKSPDTTQIIPYYDINELKINPVYQQEKNISKSSLEGNISLKIESQSISKNENERLFQTKLWINTSQDILNNIIKVSYYLHPTFHPNIISSSDKENNFTINITNWGIFTIYAKVFSKDGDIIDLTLKRDQWKNIIDKNN